MEEAGVEGLEDLVEIVVVADGGEYALAATCLADVLGLTGDRLGGDVAAVAVGVGGGDGFLVELGEQDVGDGVVDGVGCVLEDVGETDVEAAFAEADGGVEGGEAAETDVEGRDGRAGAKVSVLLFKYGDECGGHYGLRLARWVVGCRVERPQAEGVGCRLQCRIRMLQSTRAFGDRGCPIYGEYRSPCWSSVPSRQHKRHTATACLRNWVAYRFRSLARPLFRSSSIEAWLCFIPSLTVPPKTRFGAWPRWIRGVRWHIGEWPWRTFISYGSRLLCLRQ